ncbi:PKD domain-containing protein [Candidatus Woesearchaeota archaeon]|nr:PKD domain-containing protein [Candidatus Woesearchaeota archaeon]
MKLPSLALAMLLLLSVFVSAEKTIDISLSSRQVSESIIEFSVGESSFSWQHHGSNLCTKWTVYSEETGSKNKLCYGAGKCCALVNLDSYSASWGEKLNLYRGKLGATENNIVSAQVIYADYSILENPYSEIIYSSVAAEAAQFNSGIKAVSAIGQNSTISLTVYHGHSGSLRIESLAPENDKHYSKESDINIDYFVYHDSDTEVSCKLLLNGQAALQILNSSSSESKSMPNHLQEGEYSYKLACEDSSGAKAESSKKTLTEDFTPPRIILHTEDKFLTFMDYISLNFTAQENFAEEFSCRLLLDGNEKQNINVKSGELQAITLSDLENGTYEWYIRCTDSVGNTNTSAARKFLINTQQNFSLSLNKEEFGLGQKGYYIITAPYGSETTLVITNPNEDSAIAYFKDKQYPIIGEINQTKIPGKYAIEAILTYENGIKRIKKEYSVENTFKASVIASESKVPSGKDIKFEAEVSSGIGSRTYTWDFGDGKSSTGKNTNHKYDKVGTYEVILEVEDSLGNIASDTVKIYVKDSHSLEIIVKSSNEEPVKGATVFIEGEKYTTDSGGKVSQSLLEGIKRIVIIKDDYNSLNDEISLMQDISKTYYLNKTIQLNISTPKSRGNNTIPEGPEEVESHEEVKNPESSDNVDLLVEQITDALYRLDNMDRLNLEAAQTIEMEKKLQKAKKILISSGSAFHGLKYIKDEEERKQRRQELEAALEDIKTNTIVDIKVEATEEYNFYPEEKDIGEILERYFTINKNTDIGQAVKANTALQKSLLLIRTVKSINTVLLTGEEQKITLIREEFQLQDDNSRQLILSYLPKDIAKNTDEIEFITKTQIIEPDPIFTSDPLETKKVIYYIKKDIDIEKTKEIISLVVDPLAMPEKSKGFGITGFAIFSSLSGIENPALVIQIGLIILLLIIYVFYEFEILVKIRKYDILEKISPISHIKKILNRDLHQITQLMKKAEKEISEEKLAAAEDTYHELIKIYNDSLNSGLRKKVIDRISAVYNELLSHRILKNVKNIEKLASENKKEQAKQAYQDMQKLYSQLPQSWKSKISSDCKKAFDLLSK